MEYNQILEALYSKYYSEEGFSDVTSSYWRGYGAKTTITRRNQNFDINAYGISNFDKKSILRSKKHLPIDRFWSAIDVRNEEGLWLTERYLERTKNN